MAPCLFNILHASPVFSVQCCRKVPISSCIHTCLHVHFLYICTYIVRLTNNSLCYAKSIFSTNNYMLFTAMTMVSRNGCYCLLTICRKNFFLCEITLNSLKSNHNKIIFGTLNLTHVYCNLRSLNTRYNISIIWYRYICMHIECMYVCTYMPVSRSHILNDSPNTLYDFEKLQIILQRFWKSLLNKLLNLLTFQNHIFTHVNNF